MNHTTGCKKLSRRGTIFLADQVQNLHTPHGMRSFLMTAALPLPARWLTMVLAAAHDDLCGNLAYWSERVLICSPDESISGEKRNSAYYEKAK